MEKQTLHLYNHCHYGDIFLSRVLIKPLIEKFNLKFYHNLNTPILSDIENLEEINGIPIEFNQQNSNFEKGLINTWMGQENFKFVSIGEYGISFEKYMMILDKILNYYKIDKKELEYYLPEINYKKLTNFNEINDKLIDLKKIYKKFILICTGQVHSGQSSNFSFNSIIEKLSKEFPEYLFFVTSNDIATNNNVIFTSSVTKLNPDLLHISYISTFCDTIVGRSSGPYTYSLVRENLLDHNKTFISFNKVYSECNFFGNVKAKFVCSNNYDLNHIYKIIKNNISI